VNVAAPTESFCAIFDSAIMRYISRRTPPVSEAVLDALRERGDAREHRVGYAVRSDP